MNCPNDFFFQEQPNRINSKKMFNFHCTIKPGKNKLLHFILTLSTIKELEKSNFCFRRRKHLIKLVLGITLLYKREKKIKAKILNKILANQIQLCIKGIICYTK